MQARTALLWIRMVGRVGLEPTDYESFSDLPIGSRSCLDLPILAGQSL